MPVPIERALLTCLLFVCALGAPLAAQATGREPDECFSFSFGTWDPPLKTVANAFNPGEDPTPAAAAGAPRGWAARTPGDSSLILFPQWWPSGVTIEWTSARADTLVGIAHALVADGRLRVPRSAVRARRVSCAR